jgi:hypothetical protein
MRVGLASGPLLAASGAAAFRRHARHHWLPRRALFVRLAAAFARRPRAASKRRARVTSRGKPRDDDAGDTGHAATPARTFLLIRQRSACHVMQSPRPKLALPGSVKFRYGPTAPNRDRAERPLRVETRQSRITCRRLPRASLQGGNLRFVHPSAAAPSRQSIGEKLREGDHPALRSLQHFLTPAVGR